MKGRTRMQRPHGHTLSELMICLLTLGILLGIAAPSFSNLLLNSQKTQQTNTLLGLLHYARNTAVHNKEAITVCAGTTKCNQLDYWSNSLQVFPDRNSNGTRDEDEPLLRQVDLEDHYSWKWLNFRKQSSMIYESNGTTRALNGTFTLCKTGKALDQIVVSLSGRIRTQSPEKTNTCL